MKALRCVVDNTLPPPEPFPFNPEACAARELAWGKLDEAHRQMEHCWGSSLGAPGSAEKLHQVADCLQRAAAILAEIRQDPREQHRHEHWVDIYDNMRRPETFDKSPY